MLTIQSPTLPEAGRAATTPEYRRKHTVAVVAVAVAVWLGAIVLLAIDGYDFAADDISPAGSAEFVKPN